MNAASPQRLAHPCEQNLQALKAFMKPPLHQNSNREP